jgi:RNA polymerase-binding transcription factor DksA
VTLSPDPADGRPAARVPTPDPADVAHDPIDLAVIEDDLEGVEAALRRLDDGTYWTDEVTGAPIPDEVLAADPVARRAR